MQSCRRCLQSSAHTAFSPEATFVINLTRRRDRWAAISSVCHHAGLPADTLVRVPAVDGAQVNAEAAFQAGFLSRLGLRRVQEPPSHHIWGMDLNAGALGCALSHIQLWARIAAMARLAPYHANASPLEKQCFLILEDDSALVEAEDDQGTSSVPFLQELHSRMRHVPSDWELVYVGGLDTAGQCPSLRVGDGVARVPQYHRTTSAYLLTPHGARRLLATCVPLAFQLDTVMTMNVGYPAGGAQPSPTSVPYVLDPVSYTLQPPLMRQASSLGTDIQGTTSP